MGAGTYRIEVEMDRRRVGIGKVVAHYLGDGVTRATARHMECPFPEHDARRIQL